MRKIAAAMLAGVLTTATVRAHSGNEMLLNCQAWHTEAAQSDGALFARSNECFGEVIGIAHTLAYLKIVCVPRNKGITAGQTFQIVLKYLENHPEHLHENFTALAIEGLKTAWPCQ
jgi:hypothetical protein